MRAVVQDRYGGSEALHLEERAVPTLDPDEVLVRVAAAGVDRGAYHLIRGVPYLMRVMGFGLRRPKVPVPGSNLAGWVEQVGASVTRYRPGDEVYGTADGSFADYVVSDVDRLANKPESLTFEEAAALPYPGTTSLQAVRDVAGVAAGQRVLVIGASGAVGTIAVQIAKAFDAEVTGVCSAVAADLVRALGADRVIDYERENFADDRYDIILDIGGNTPLAELRRALVPEGTLVIVGGENGGRLLGGIHRQLAALALDRFSRQNLRTFIARDGSEILDDLNELVERFRIRPVN